MTSLENPDGFKEDEPFDEDAESVPQQQPQVENGRYRAGDAEAIEALQGLLHFVVDNLIDEPESARIEVEQRANMVALSVRLPEEELGKIIGRGGRIAKSIRTALMVAGSQYHLRVSLDIDSIEGPVKLTEDTDEPDDETEFNDEPGP